MARISGARTLGGVRRVLPSVLLAILLAVPTTAAAGGGAPAAAVPCGSASVSLRVEASSLRDGAGDVGDACIPPGAFYEVRFGGYRLALGLALRGDGTEGRVAFGVLTTPVGLAAALVGIEDVEASGVRWAYAEGRHETVDPALGFSGEGMTDLPGESARVSLELHGTGQDLLTADGEVAEQLRAMLFVAIAELTG